MRKSNVSFIEAIFCELLVAIHLLLNFANLLNLKVICPTKYFFINRSYCNYL